MTKKEGFKTRARIINQLGEQLIKNEGIALLELIKNSYDAYASKCEVTILHPEKPAIGQIIIKDDGIGMNEEVLRNGWLEIGTDNKTINKDKIEKNKPKKFKDIKRLPLGEKGIGRLGVHRLGKVIKIETRMFDEDEYVLEIDWNDIEKSKYIEDIPYNLSKREPLIFKDKSGTRITISELRIPWERGIARNCARSITALNSPFESIESFHVSFSIPNTNWLEKLLTFSEIEKDSLFSFDITLSKKEITNFEYNFTPWETMTKLKPRRVTTPEIINLKRMIKKVDKKEVDIDLSKYKIGDVKFKGLIFDLDSRTLELGVNDRTGLKTYLKQNGGIKVFRDNMRVMDYGEQGNDWLDLGGRRINIPAKRISNNIILGAVYLDRDRSQDLQEKANREGFVENNAYWELWYAIRFAVDRIESFRLTDKNMLRKFYGPKQTMEPVLSSLSDLKLLVDENIKNINLSKKFHAFLVRIEEDYENITNSLIKSAGAGLNLIFVIHQIEKIVKEIKVMLKSKSSNKYIEERVNLLIKLVEGYSILIKKSDLKPRNIQEIIEQSIFTMQFRLDAHRIALNTNYLTKDKNYSAICSEDHVINALMNLFDNSIWWLGYSKTKNPSIYLHISEQLKGYISIVFADNGPGFTKSTEEIIKPFVSDKPGGMGIGLHLTKQIMLAQRGKLLFPDLEYFDIPKEFQSGAIIALAFKKGENL